MLPSGVGNHVSVSEDEGGTTSVPRPSCCHGALEVRQGISGDTVLYVPSGNQDFEKSNRLDGQEVG